MAAGVWICLVGERTLPQLARRQLGVDAGAGVLGITYSKLHVHVDIS